MGEKSALGAYAPGADLLAAIEAGLAALGRGGAVLRPEDLAAVDEFHLGGRQATAALAGRLGLAPGVRLLDIGSGLGGPARYFAAEHGCDVTGIDATDAFVTVAEALTARVGLADHVRFIAGSATAMPFADAEFAGVTMLHVGMNIADKRALFTEVRRVLRPGGFFAIFDIMAEGDVGTLAYPMPWAMEAEASFVERPPPIARRWSRRGFTLPMKQACARPRLSSLPGCARGPAPRRLACIS